MNLTFTTGIVGFQLCELWFDDDDSEIQELGRSFKNRVVPWLNLLGGSFQGYAFASINPLRCDGLALYRADLGPGRLWYQGTGPKTVNWLQRSTRPPESGPVATSFTTSTSECTHSEVAFSSVTGGSADASELRVLLYYIQQYRHTFFLSNWWKFVESTKVWLVPPRHAGSSVLS